MNTRTRNGQCQTKSRRRNHAFPHFGNIINEVMNSTMGDVLTNTHKHYTSPAVNITEDESAYHLYMTLPGYQKSDVAISVDKNVLIISSDTEHSDDRKFRLREFNYGKFKRRFTLSDKADAKNIDAAFDNGILHITVAKKDKEELKAKTIEIK